MAKAVRRKAVRKKSRAKRSTASTGTGTRTFGVDEKLAAARAVVDAGKPTEDVAAKLTGYRRAPKSTRIQEWADFYRESGKDETAFRMKFKPGRGQGGATPKRRQRGRPAAGPTSSPTRGFSLQDIRSNLRNAFRQLQADQRRLSAEIRSNARSLLDVQRILAALGGPGRKAGSRMERATKK